MVMANNLVSVVVPAYNEEQVLSEFYHDRCVWFIGWNLSLNSLATMAAYW